MPKVKRNHLPALDGIRAVAVFIVILYHSGVVEGIPGDLGVTAFFVLSGFLITWLLLKEVHAKGSISLREFYIGRTLRIFPAYYVFILFSLLADAALHHYWSVGLIAAAVGYVVNYYNAFLGHPVTSVSHAWSLAVEEQFYLIWPFTLVVFWRKGRRATINLLCVIVLGVVAWRFVLFGWFHVPVSYIYNAFDTRCDALGIGCLMALLGPTQHYKAVERLVARYAWLPAITLFLIWYSRTQMSAAYHYTLGISIDALLLAILLVQMLQLSESAPWSILNTRAMRWLGLISYPCYLYHGWGLAVGQHALKSLGKIPEFVAGYLATVVIAACSYYVVERPFLTVKERMRTQAATAELPKVEQGIG